MDYKNRENISIIVALLKANNISDLVLSPGGTNISVIRAVQDDVFFNCYSVIDERSAAYVAIGMYLQHKKPVAIICTSAQATRNYIPGLTEAFYKKVPILAITMEKHPRFTYQEYMQAPDQTSLPKDCVKQSFELPYISDINDYYHAIRVANQAILEMTRNGCGPVQLCVPWLDFQLADIKPEIRSIRRYNVTDIQNEDLSEKRILLLIGEHLPFRKDERVAIDNFCSKTNSIVYVNHLSNFINEYTIEANLFLTTASIDEINELKPDIIISIGGQTGDYPFYLSFSKNNLVGVEHWRISEDGAVVDTYDKLTRVYQGELVEFFMSVKSSCVKHDYYNIWKTGVDSKTTEIAVPFSHVAIAQYLHNKIPHNSIMQFSILNSLRIWNFFHLDSSIQCYSNVGAFGIDGGMSTLVGQSLVSDKMSFMIIGDLAFLYDMNCLSIREIKNNIRILLINNNGGIEFKLYEGKNTEIDQFIAAANYHGSAKEWAESCGFVYYSARNMDEFSKCSDAFISRSFKSILLEVFVSDQDESDAYLKIINENRKRTTKDSVKSVVKGILGQDPYNKLKRKLKG